jgi:uncharacterized protein YidB (DUF937 family)
MERGDTAGGGGGDPRGGVDAAALARSVATLLGGEPGSSLGGLGGLQAAFDRAGLGAAFQSWVGAGANQAITPAELERALGAGAVAGLARAHGVDPARVAAGLAAVLPVVVDQLTPGGVLPAGEGDPAALARPRRGR